MATTPDYYEVLQVSPDASWAEIRAAYARLRIDGITETQPDSPAARQRMALLSEAFNVLGNAKSRQEYDLQRRRSAPRTPGKSPEPSAASVPRKPSVEVGNNTRATVAAGTRTAKPVSRAELTCNLAKGATNTLAKELLRPEEWFQFYANPFEALGLTEATFEGEIDRQAIRRAKTRLLHDVECDGKAPGLGNHPLDVSRVHALCDELDDPTKARYHRVIYQDEPLLRFLTRGDIKHFARGNDGIPQWILDLADSEPAFQMFLSKPFAQQYNLVLERAIEQRLMAVVEVLISSRLPISSRRWVKPEDEEVCFEGASRKIDAIVQLMREKAAEGRDRKPVLSDVEDFLQRHSIAELLNLLPNSFFAQKKTDAIHAIREIAIHCVNEHHDPDLAKATLGICKRITCPRADLTQKLEEDLRTIDGIVADRLVVEIVEKVIEAKTRKVSLDEMEALLRQLRVAEFFNRDASAFTSQRTDLLDAIRQLAIHCFNVHGDAELARSMLSLCQRFYFHSPEVATRIEKDHRTIDQIISEGRKHSFSGWVQPGKLLEIGSAGITYGGSSMSPSEIVAMRWGTFVQTVNGSVTERAFSLVLRNGHSTLAVEWDMPTIFAAVKKLLQKRETVVPIAERSPQEQEAFFSSMIDAVFHHIAPSLIERMVQRLRAEGTVVIGPCTLSPQGIAFRTGLIFQKDHHLPWREVDSEIQNGHVLVRSRGGKAHLSMSMKDTDNAVLLPFLCDLMAKEASTNPVVAQPPRKQQSPTEPVVSKPPQKQESPKGPTDLEYIVYGGCLGIFILGVGMVLLIGIALALANPGKSSASGKSPTSGKTPTLSKADSTTSSAPPPSTQQFVFDAQVIEELSKSQKLSWDESKLYRIASILGQVDWEIEKMRSLLDHSNPREVKEFDRKVAAYNSLLKKYQAEYLRLHGRAPGSNDKP